MLDYRGGVLSLAEEDAHQAITAATRNNVTIYPIDPRGLTPDGGLGAGETAPTIDVTARMQTTQDMRSVAQSRCSPRSTRTKRRSRTRSISAPNCVRKTAA